LKGPGERLVEDSITITLGANDSVYINGLLTKGPKTVKAKDKDIIKEYKKKILYFRFIKQEYNKHS
jgi:hypothetical protein